MCELISVVMIGGEGKSYNQRPGGHARALSIIASQMPFGSA